MMTTPESPETIEAQLQWLREGKRRAVLLTPGCLLPEFPPWSDCMPIELGLVIFDCRRLSRQEVSNHLASGTLNELLGYGAPGKPPADDPAARVVVVRDGASGAEKQAVVAGSKHLDAAQRQAEAVKDPGDTVTVEDGCRVLTDRLKSLDARELKVRPCRAEDWEALVTAAAAEQHSPLNPTHVIERHGEIVGCFGCSSLPLYRLWFHSKEVKAADSLRLLFMIENHYRMAGVQTLGTIINTSSPFYPVASRGGYLESGGDRLFLKDL